MIADKTNEDIARIFEETAYVRMGGSEEERKAAVEELFPHMKKEIKEAYQAVVDHPISASQIYSVLHRHGWHKDVLRDWHPPKAANATIKVSKK